MTDVVFVDDDVLGLLEMKATSNAESSKGSSSLPPRAFEFAPELSLRAFIACWYACANLCDEPARPAPSLAIPGRRHCSLYAAASAEDNNVPSAGTFGAMEVGSARLRATSPMDESASVGECAYC